MECDMQIIGSFLHCASRGDKVGLNQMLRDGTSPDVQDYDRRTALHLAASEGHASIVELLILYNVNVNLEDRWQRTPLMDARLYGHKDIIRILEVNGGRDSFDERPMTIRHEHGLNEVNIDPSELTLEHSSVVEQGNLCETWSRKIRLDTFIAIRHALDIARGLNYLHQHKPQHIVHNFLSPRNLLQDEGGHLKIGEYWVQMLYDEMFPNHAICTRTSSSNSPLSDTKADLYSFALILYEMVEGRPLFPNLILGSTNLNIPNSEPKFKLNRCSSRIQQLIKDCLKGENDLRPTFDAVIEILEEDLSSLAKPGCRHVC